MNYIEGKKRELNYQFDNTIYAAVEKREIRNKIPRDFFDSNKESLKRIKEIYNSKNEITFGTL